MKWSTKQVCTAAAAAGCAILSAGCMATGVGHRVPTAVIREDQGILDDKMRRLESDVKTLMLEMDDLKYAVERMQADSANASTAQFNAQQDAMDALQSRVKEVESARVKDREEIVAKLSQKVAALVNASSGTTVPSGGGTRPTGQASEFGYEHTVKPGETLSHIAQAYGVSANSIIQANGLKNPKTLRVDQKLFIPE